MSTQEARLFGYRRENADPPYLHPEYRATRVRAPKQPLIPLAHTLSEITGPVYGDRPLGELDHDLTRQHDGEPLGERITVSGRVLDGQGRPIRGALVEVWSATARAWGRCGTHPDGRFEFVLPRAPHYEVYVFARGLLRHQLTRLYFPDASDPLLASLTPEERATLVAQPDGDGLRFDIRMQGESQTVFFAT